MAIAIVIVIEYDEDVITYNIQLPIIGAAVAAVRPKPAATSDRAPSRKVHPAASGAVEEGVSPMPKTTTQPSSNALHDIPEDMSSHGNQAESFPRKLFRTASDLFMSSDAPKPDTSSFGTKQQFRYISDMHAKTKGSYDMSKSVKLIYTIIWVFDLFPYHLL